MSDDPDLESDPEYQHMQPLADSAWKRNQTTILAVAVAVVMGVAGLVVLVVAGNS